MQGSENGRVVTIDGDVSFYENFPGYKIKLCTGLDNISKYYSCTMKTQGSHPVSNFEAKAPFKSIEKK
jgi:hypothetical protein